MTSGIMVFQIGAVTAIGIFISYLMYLLMSHKENGKKIKDGPAALKVEAQKDKNNIFDAALKILSEKPKSKESLQIKIYAAVIVFAVILILSLKIIFALLVGIGTFIAIGLYFNSQINKKLELFDNQLIEALGMLANSVRAGQSFMQALENMVKDTKDPISSQFADALRQVKLGVSVNKALEEITERIRSKDLKIVITSINLARETGGNLGEILSRIADTMRERKKIRGKINALTAQGRMSGMVMGAVPFILLFVLYFIEPEIMGLLFTTLLGNLMLTVAVIMISLGMFVINKIISIDI
ncbi:MAG: type II secretion system F family protein [Elusimicrobia bacterium]|nr:type II secretion system F family protein [Elusimicrobiota bacterium]